MSYGGTDVYMSMKDDQEVWLHLVKDGQEENAHFSLEESPGTFTSSFLKLVGAGADSEVAMLMEERDETDSKLYQVVEEQPMFDEGDAALLEFLKANMQYPAVAEEQGVQGRVLVQFVVELDGTLSDVKVIRGVDPFLDKEALRVIQLSNGRWKPGKQHGKEVRTQLMYPVFFRLSNK